MKKKLKKAIATVLVSAMACSLAACGSAGSEDAPSASEGSSSADGVVEISLYTTIPGKDPEFEEIVADFMEANQDVKVNYIAYDSSEKQKWMPLISWTTLIIWQYSVRTTRCFRESTAAIRMYLR